MQQLYTVKEVMSVLKISRTGLYRLIADKKLRPIKLGERTLFKETELKRFIDSLKPKE